MGVTGELGQAEAHGLGGQAGAGRGDSPCVHFMTLSQQQRGDKGTISRRKKKPTAESFPGMVLSSALRLSPGGVGDLTKW